jgi:hypothetical protein
MAINDPLAHLPWRRLSGAGGCFEVALTGDPDMVFLRNDQAPVFYIGGTIEELRSMRDAIKDGALDDV